MTHWSKRIPILACREAKAWVKTQPNFKTAWKNCQRGDWMLWLLTCGKIEQDSDYHHRVVLCACECARLALPHLPQDELRPLRAIETAERWVRREATLEEVKMAARAAAQAAQAAWAAWAAGATEAAAWAAAEAAAWAARATSAAEAAAWAAEAAAWAAARAAGAADIVRKYFSVKEASARLTFVEKEKQNGQA